jgi:putative nucleotidyltransferase with HDIG domain
MVVFPDKAECFRLMDAYGMLPNIRRHSVVVAQVALQLVEGFKEGGMLPPEAVNPDFILAGALLHDIAKTPCLENGGDHARVGGQICRQLGYPDIARIVEEHVLLKDHDASRRSRGEFTAQEIIYYADKRVRHDEIVSLDDRLQYILHHYGLDDLDLHRRIRLNFAKCVALEHSLFGFLPFTAEELAGLVASRGDESLFGFTSMEGVDE